MPISEIGTFIRGTGLQKSDLLSAGFPAIHYGQIHTKYGTKTKTTVSFTSPELAQKLRKASPGDLLIATTSEDDEAVAKATAWVGNSEVALSGDALILKHKLEPRYISYFYQTSNFHIQKQRYITGTKVRRISSDSLGKILIPIPPPDVQTKIADQLDKFDALVNDLTVGLPAELEARRKQYEYYRDKLLTFKELEA